MPQKPPHGFRRIMSGQIPGIECDTCHRKWKAERLDIPGNREFLIEHAQEHAIARAVDAEKKVASANLAGRRRGRGERVVAQLLANQVRDRDS